MADLYPSETSVSYRTTRRHILEDKTLINILTVRLPGPTYMCVSVLVYQFKFQFQCRRIFLLFPVA
jgi:hypothetical protein